MNKNEALVLMLMSLGAFFMPFTSRRLMLPSSVGEIIFGMILGSVLTVNADQMQLVQYFSAFGFLVLMYLAGLELDFERFRTLPKRDLWLYVFMFLPVIIIASIFTFYLNLHWAFILIFFTTGLGLVFPVLKDTQLVKTDLGQNILILAMIGEIMTLIGLTIVTLTYKYGFTAISLLHIMYIVIFFLVIYLILRIMRVALWWNPGLQSLFLMVGNPTETGIRANFVILFFFVALSALVQLELVVGAFIGGMMFALVFAGREAVLDKLGGVGYGFFIPVFFISVGMRVSFSDFLQIKVIIFALIITGILLLTRFAGSLLLFFSSIGRSQIALVATALSFPLTMLVAVSSICYDAGIISKMESSSVLLAAMMSAIIYPWLFKVGVGVLLPDIGSGDK